MVKSPQFNRQTLDLVTSDNWSFIKKFGRFIVYRRYRPFLYSAVSSFNCNIYIGSQLSSYSQDINKPKCMNHWQLNNFTNDVIVEWKYLQNWKTVTELCNKTLFPLFTFLSAHNLLQIFRCTNRRHLRGVKFCTVFAMFCTLLCLMSWNWRWHDPITSGHLSQNQ